jgi:hypothetical protein
MQLNARLRLLTKNRAVQFLALGSLIFLLTPRPETSRDIALTRQYLGRLERAEAAKKGRAEESAVDERAIEDEVLYREGLRIGFDKNDAVVKQRLIQKVLFYAEELKGAAEPPSEADLRGFYLLTRPTWKRPAHHHFRQIFMKDRAPLEALEKRLNERSVDPSTAFKMGDPCPIPRELTAFEDDLKRTLGEAFVEELSLAKGSTSPYFGPIASAYGYHLIQALGDAPAEIAPFEEVEARVREVYLTKRREDAVNEFLVAAFRRYRVSIDGQPVTSISPQHRLSFRVDESGED